MQQKKVSYGEIRNVEVFSASKQVIVVTDDDNEGYFLVGHGLENNLPEKGEKGIITFTPNNTPTKGHWHYTKKQ